MYRIALKLTNDTDNASDIVQEVFISLFDKIRNGNEILYPAAWLYKAIVNKCCDSIKRQKRFGSIELIKNFEAEEEPERLETTSTIHLALSQLKPQERILITLYSEGLSYKEIAGASGDTMYGKHMGNRKSLLIMPDGSVVVNHAYRNYYTKFSPTGKFEKEFGVKNSKGTQFKKINQISGIINNNFYTGLDNMGNMMCFDFNGNYVKTLKLNYMARQMISLPNNKVAVVGWVIWETKFRDFISIVDYDTNKEQIIWDHYTERCMENEACKPFNYRYMFKERGGFSFSTMPYLSNIGLSSPPQIATSGNKLIVALPQDGRIMVFNLDGKQLGSSKIDWATNYISIEEQREIQQKAIDKFKSIEKPLFAKWVSPEENKQALESILKLMETDLSQIKDPIPIPVFSTILKDSDGNLLFFEFPKEENANMFNVWIYENGGKFVCQSSFVTDDYKLEINPSKMVFHNGYIYALQHAKDASGVPLRLVRFKLTNK